MHNGVACYFWSEYLLTKKNFKYYIIYNHIKIILATYKDQKIKLIKTS